MFCDTVWILKNSVLIFFNKSLHVKINSSQYFI